MSAPPPARVVLYGGPNDGQVLHLDQSQIGALMGELVVPGLPSPPEFVEDTGPHPTAVATYHRYRFVEADRLSMYPGDWLSHGWDLPPGTEVSKPLTLFIEIRAHYRP